MGFHFRDKSASSKFFTEINITPLTDVMLVLLVIFMVTTPLLMVESFKLKLPAASTGTVLEAGKTVIVTISESGYIEVNGLAVNRGGLYSELKKELSAPSSDRSVLVKADESVRHKLVVEALDAARLAGAQRLSIATARVGKIEAR